MSGDTGAKDVIVADNDYIVRGILRSVLDGQGFTVIQAVNGLEAIEYATRTSARLIILDYKMPKMDGLSACAKIRRLSGYGDVPIAILTAFDNKETRAAAERAGATTLIAKPFTPFDLLRRVGALLGQPVLDGGVASGDSGPAMRVWKRRHEPVPVFGEPPVLSEGRRVLKICRH